MGDIIDQMTGAQLIGVIIGGLAGLTVGNGIASPRWLHIGGGWFTQTDEGMGCIPGCLVQLLCVGIGVGIGYAVGSIF